MPPWTIITDQDKPGAETAALLEGAETVSAVSFSR